MSEELIKKILVSVGGVILADDIADFGKFDRLHHWQIGALMVASPLVIEIFKKLNEK